MKLFTVGPVEMFPQTLEVSGKQLPYFRTPEFSEIMLDNERLLKESIHAPAEAKVVFLTASGTAAMEACIINCFSAKDRMLVVNGGGFGKRFCDLCEVHNIPYDSIDLKFGETLAEENLTPYEEREYTALLVNLHETSTGQLYDIQMLSRFCKKKGMYLVVDAISAYGADDIDFSEDAIDLLIISSQKALALSPGLSMIVVSERIYREKVSQQKPGSLYFDFKLHVDNLKRGQTPFTPAVGILLELHDRLLQIQVTGMEHMQKKRCELAVQFRGGLKEHGFEIPAFPLSNALTPVILPSQAKRMYERLKEDFGLVVTPNGGELAEDVIRIGHLGNLNWKDYEQLLEAMIRIRETL